MNQNSERIASRVETREIMKSVHIGNAPMSIVLVVFVFNKACIVKVGKQK